MSKFIFRGEIGHSSVSPHSFEIFSIVSKFSLVIIAEFCFIASESKVQWSLERGNRVSKKSEESTNIFQKNILVSALENWDTRIKTPGGHSQIQDCLGQTGAIRMFPLQ